MAEVLVAYDSTVINNGMIFRPRAVGRRAEDGMWEGWLEFIPSSGDHLVGPVESRQPEYGHLVYWATGLTPVFLEGALVRALRPSTTRVRVVEEPLSDFPAPRATAVRAVPQGPEPVLDPFDIGNRNMDILKQELSALNRPRLLNIIAAYGLNPSGEDISWMSDAQLGTFIVTATEARLALPRP